MDVSCATRNSILGLVLKPNLGQGIYFWHVVWSALIDIIQANIPRKYVGLIVKAMP